MARASSVKSSSSSKSATKTATPATTPAVVEPVVVPVVTPPVEETKAVTKKKGGSSGKKKGAESSVPVVAPVPVVEEPVAVVADTAGVVDGHTSTDNLFMGCVSGAVERLASIEKEARLLRQKLKKLLYAGKKQMKRSRKSQKAQKGEDGTVVQTPFQTLLAEVKSATSSLSSDSSSVSKSVSRLESSYRQDAKTYQKSQKAKRKNTPPSASTKMMVVSPEVLTFMGAPAGTLFSRRDVFAAIRSHIKEKSCYFEGRSHKFIKPDDRLMGLFKSVVPADKLNDIDYFNMQSYLKGYFTNIPVSA